ncbi:hypothetical protein [Agromyces marinus]|uniref:DUF4065 domain-containing protein n=1 Tax=Agromyces marinus TaxID=1389020 RepID=A0ABN6YDC2_9MICO|nr:hypothetical protein [Agromyces marinus]UIP57777.1 hypothetical protein DSM26151_06430 [Agromyces marinus]BDZ54046.1 hypothetical protein GCM10025870_11190 [Agromyces marinus]
MSEPTEFEVDDAIVLLLGSDPGPAERRGEIRGITRLEKLVFLLEHETEAQRSMTESADFEAYNFGPFSQKVYQAVDVLRSGGLIKDTAESSASNEDQYEVSMAVGNDAAPVPYSTRDFALTPLGREYYDALVRDLPAGTVRAAESLRKRFAGWPLRRLIRYVYQQHDEYTTKSVIRDDILGRP